MRFSYVMAIGEAEAFSERMKRELVALECANVYALMETESVVEEVFTFEFDICSFMVCFRFSVPPCSTKTEFDDRFLFSMPTH